jgi:choline dehydrogenase-like flavoprotein
MALTGGAGALTAGATVGPKVIPRVWAAVTTPRIQYRSLASLSKTRSFDVVIIGSGPAGAILGRDLVNKGINTLILEAGPNLNKPDPNIKTSALEIYRNSGSIEYPVAASHLRAIGGTSAMWSGRTPRLHPLDFEPNAYTPDGAEWPIRYADLEPYYDRAEQTLRVSGSKLSEYYPPKRFDYPLPPRDDISALKSLVDTVGVVVDDCPTSLGLRNEGRPLRVASDILPFFTASGHGVLVSGAVVTQILANSGGDIEGLEVCDFHKLRRIITAKTYVIACGGLESARMLLLSRSDAFPHGIGNNHDLVGRFFNEHPNIALQGQLPPGKKFVSIEIGRSHQFYDSFKQQNFGSIIMLFSTNQDGSILKVGASTEMLPAPDNRISLASDLKDAFGNPGMDVSVRYSRKDLETFEAAYEVMRSIMEALGVTDIQQQPEGWSSHHIGTTRMGADPATSVVDANLRVHGTSNLYVLGSSVFVTGGASNPTLTIAALAHRLGDHLAAV